MNPRQLRWVGTAGMASFVLLVVAALVAPLWDGPTTDSSPGEVAAYYAANRGAVLVSLLLYGLSMGLFGVLAAAVWALLRQGEPAPGALSAIYAFGAVATLAMVLAGFAQVAVLAYREVGGELARTLNDLGFGLIAFSGIPTATFLGAYAALVHDNRTGLPAWTGWLALLGAAAHLLVAASFLFDDGPLSLEGAVIIAVPATFFAWIFGVSFALLRLAEAKPAPPQGPS